MFCSHPHPRSFSFSLLGFVSSLQADVEEFLAFAELMFHKRHYGGRAQPAYLAGAAPNRVVKMFDRRVSWNANETARALSLPSHHAALAAAAEAAAAEEGSVLPVKAPRRVFAFHCHREILYGLIKFLGLRVDVARPGLPRGLVHPGSGIFFELWRDPAAAEAAQLANAEEPALDPNRANKLRYEPSPVDAGYYVRAVVWVPCWPGDGVSTAANDTAPAYCPGRVRVLPGCGGTEFCRYDRFKQLLSGNFKAVGGDFRRQCPMEPEGAEVVLAAAKQKAATAAKKAATAHGHKGKGKSAAHGHKGKHGAASHKLMMLESAGTAGTHAAHGLSAADADDDSEAALHAADEDEDVADAYAALAAAYGAPPMASAAAVPPAYKGMTHAFTPSVAAATGGYGVSGAGVGAGVGMKATGPMGTSAGFATGVNGAGVGFGAGAGVGMPGGAGAAPGGGVGVGAWVQRAAAFIN